MALESTGYELKTVEEFLGPRMGRVRKVTGREFDYYSEYVVGIMKEIKERDIPDEEKLLSMNRLFLTAKNNVLPAGKQTYMPSKGKLKKILDAYTSFVDDLNTSIPDIVCSNVSVTDFEDIGIDLAISKEGKISLLPPYYLARRNEQILTINEEAAHNALSQAPFSIISERKNSLLELYDSGAALYEDERLDEFLKSEFKKVDRTIMDKAYELEERHPTRALREGAALFLSEKALSRSPNSQLRKGFEEYLDSLKRATDQKLKIGYHSRLHSRFKLLGYQTLKKMEERNTESVRELARLKDDFEMFELAGVDVKDLGLMSTYYKEKE